MATKNESSRPEASNLSACLNEDHYLAGEKSVFFYNNPQMNSENRFRWLSVSIPLPTEWQTISLDVFSTM